MKHVQIGLSARDDRESSFHHCGSPLRLVQACLCASPRRLKRRYLVFLAHMQAWTSNTGLQQW